MDATRRRRGRTAPARRHADRPRAGRGRRLRLDRVAGAAAALAASAARRSATTCGCTRPSRSPPTTTSRRTGCWGPPQAALSHEFADIGDGYGFLIECAQATTGLFAGAVPWRSGADHKRRMREWDHAAPLISLAARARPRPGRDRRRRQRRSPTIRSPTSSTSATSAPGSRQLVRDPRGGRGDARSSAAARKAPDWNRGDDLEAFIADAQRARDRQPREFLHLLRPPDGHLPDGRATRRPRSPNPWGELHDTPGRLDRRRERLPERLRHEPDG